MKKLLQKFLITIAIILSFATVGTIVTTQPTYADSANGAGFSCRYLLGMTSWDCGLKDNPETQDELVANVVKIASNVLLDLGIISAYLILAFVIYGGYLYMFSSGDPAKAANSRKVLTRAFIGLAIVLLANVILNTIRFALIRNTSFADVTAENAISADELFINGINWVIAIAGIVAIIFVIVGAVGYMTSTGDAGKLQKAKNTILYALIGLVVVGLAAVITAFVSNLIRNAGSSEGGYINQTIIAKELNEK